MLNPVSGSWFERQAEPESDAAIHRKVQLIPQAVHSGNPMRTISLTAIIEREDDGYVALCPEVDVASQGVTVEDARSNLQEALDLFFETASPAEVASRLQRDLFVTRMEVAVG